MITVKGTRVIRREVDVEVPIHDTLIAMHQEWIARAPTSSMMADFIDDQGFWSGKLGDVVTQFQEASPEEKQIDAAFKLLIQTFAPKKVLE